MREKKHVYNLIAFLVVAAILGTIVLASLAPDLEQRAKLATPKK